MSDTVLTEMNDHVATVTLNRGEKLNALNTAMFEGLTEAAEQLRSTPGLRSVIIHGAGGNFCAGLDMSMFDTVSRNTPLTTRTHGITNLFQQVAWAWHELEVPVIAAIEGYCFGGGLQIACGADMRYIHPSSKLSIMEIKWGLVPDMAGSQLWNRFVKQDLLRELSFTGEVFSGETALNYGFATRLTPEPLELARKIAADIASKNPDAIRANKALINRQDHLEQDQGLLLESELQDKLLGKPNQIEAVTANMQKRAPVFAEPQ